MTNQTPTMKAYSRHLLICTHGTCAESDAAAAIQRQVHQLNRAHQRNRLQNPERVQCTAVACFGICHAGPIVAVYPDGVWYHHVDEAVMQQIYEAHILGGQPVEAHIFHRLYPSGEEPTYPPQVRGDAGTFQEATTPAEVTTETPTSEAVQTKVRRAKKKKGLVIVNTGDGKGKTTAALGVMTRAWGRQMRIGVLQFLKNENAKFGEIKAVERMGDIDWIATGDGWTWTSKDMDETQAKARHGWEVAKQRISSGAYDLIVLDEFTYTMHFGWLDTAEVIAWLQANKPEMLHLIITGRSAPDALVAYADLVTEMREIKHPFTEQGIRAQAGIEY